ncbi:Nif3-like dinuclear metal center hexameric protein [bacterium]|nr:Nif3-like dinuclear metal center hexameric protein [bacterium]
MAKTKDIIEKLEKIAPLETQEDWDNSGWQIDLGIKTIKNVLLSLNVTTDTIHQAIKQNCELIISHHPLIFKPLKSIKNKVIISAIQNKIQIYSLHTNFDKSQIGTTQTLADLFKKSLNLKTLKDLNDFVKIATLKEPIKSEDFILAIKNELNLKNLKIANPRQEIKSVAFCAGAGADFVQEVKQHQIDCFITSDIKYHQALDSGIMLVDIGHFESEVISLKSIEKLLKSCDVNIIIAKEEPVFEIV